MVNLETKNVEARTMIKLKNWVEAKESMRFDLCEKEGKVAQVCDQLDLGQMAMGSAGGPAWK